MAFEPRRDVGMLMGSVVVDDDVDGLFRGHSGIDGIEEADELLMAMTLHALADHPTFEHVEGGKQGGDAMTLVIMGPSAGATLLHRQPRLGPVERLDLALLIDREHDGMVGRIDVEPDDVLEFGRKARVIGQLEVAHAVWLQAMGAPDALNRADAD